MIVRNANDEWELWTRDGKRLLGTHRTKHEAVSQERAIDIAKARRAGHRIPRPKSRR